MCFKRLFVKVIAPQSKAYKIAMNRLLLLILFFVSGFVCAQTKVSGMVIDENGDAVSFANAYFKDSTEGTITNDDGRFYLESDTTYSTLIISFLGYAT